MLIGGGGASRTSDSSTVTLATATTFNGASAAAGGNTSGVTGKTAGTPGGATGGIVNFSGLPGQTVKTLAGTDANSVDVTVLQSVVASPGFVYNYPHSSYGFSGESGTDSNDVTSGGGGGACMGWFEASELASSEFVVVGVGGTGSGGSAVTIYPGNSGMALIKEYVQI